MGPAARFAVFRTRVQASVLVRLFEGGGGPMKFGRASSRKDPVRSQWTILGVSASYLSKSFHAESAGSRSTVIGSASSANSAVKGLEAAGVALVPRDLLLYSYLLRRYWR